MKIIRRLCIVVCIIAVAAFAGLRVYQKMNVDHDPPEIAMDADTVEISVSDGDDAILNGVTAKDGKDGDVTDSLIVEKLDRFDGEMNRQATIAAFDSSGNVAKMTRTVHYTDYTPPKLQITSPLAASLENRSDILEYITVTDVLEGDITDNLQLVSGQAISRAGSYQMTIQCSNSAGDTLEVPVTVELYDRGSYTPKIELTEYCVYVAKGGSFNPVDYLSALNLYGREYAWNAETGTFDDESDTHSQSRYGTQESTIPGSDVQITNPVNTAEAGSYEVTYTLQDEEDDGGIVHLIVIVQ